MPHIRFEHRTYALGDNESVLDGLTRHGVSVPSSCRSGICQTCIMRAVQGTPPPASQASIKESLRARNFFLACACKPTEDLEVALPGNDDIPLTAAEVIGKDALNHDITRLRLRTQPGLVYRAGQFVNLHHDEVVRSYSLASVPQTEDFIELHVQRIAHGRLSGWLHDECTVGTTLSLQGPLGDCYYSKSDVNQALLLIGTGSGLAPLWGIARDALAQGHSGPIHLFHGSRTAAGLYLMDALQALAQRHPNFQYTACVSGGGTQGDYRLGRANEIALADYPQLKGWQVFLCGNADMVKTTKKKAFLAGAALKDIHADPFEFSATPSTEQHHTEQDHGLSCTPLAAQRALSLTQRSRAAD